MGNQLISFRLNPELVQAIASRYPGLSPSEGAKALILETLGMVASPDVRVQGLDEILDRIERLEKKVFAPDTPNDTLTTPDDTLQTPNNDDPVSTPNDTLMTPDDTLQTPELSSIVADDTLLTPDDTREIIGGLLATNPEIKSLRGIVDLLKTKNIKIPGKAGTVQPTISNIKPFLPDWWVKG